ncbi:hypothetical protein ACPVPU_11670 [Sphingomonas sp. CJ99]
MAGASMALGDGDRWPPSASAAGAGDMDRSVNRRLSGAAWMLGDAPVVPASCPAAAARRSGECNGDRQCLAGVDRQQSLCEAAGLWRD